MVAIATKSPVYDKVVSNLQESRARGACIIAVATEGDEEIAKHANHVIYVPKVRDAFSPITASVPLQLLSRAVAVKRGCDVDQPRNLAKSVTGRIASNLFRRRARPRGGAFAYPR